MNKKRKILITLLVVVLIAASVIGLHQSLCYGAQDVAKSAMQGNSTVSVEENKKYIFFDGPGSSSALIFYPGAMVDADAYAPLLSEIAKGGMDCFVVKMPLDFALYNVNGAAGVMEDYSYDSWFMGGHSLGGVAAGKFCNKHMDKVDGLLLLASYTIDEVNTKSDFEVVSIYGTNDMVLKKDKLQESVVNYPTEYTEKVINGANHAQFGDYGAQRKDGDASITAQEQIELTAEYWLDIAL